jgi:hypothetical protein
MHYTLTLAYRPVTRKQRRAIQAAVKCHKLTHTSILAMTEAAAALSKLPGVDRVVATYISETHEGTWRKGKRT